MITDRRKFTTKPTLYGISLVSIYTVEINLKPFPWNLHSVQEMPPNFLRRPMRVDNMANNADMMTSLSRMQSITIDY